MRTALTLILALLAACVQLADSAECMTDDCLQCTDDCLQPTDESTQ